MAAKRTQAGKASSAHRAAKRKAAPVAPRKRRGVPVAQSSTQSALPGVRRTVGRPFPKGVSGNPGGQPKGLVRTIREQTREGDELVDFMLGVFRGRHKQVRLRDRIDAATWLADRAFGRPMQHMEHTGRDGQPLISLAMLQQLIIDDDEPHDAVSVG